jgi:hypothetical protein
VEGSEAGGPGWKFIKGPHGNNAENLNKEANGCSGKEGIRLSMRGRDERTPYIP